MTDKDKQGVAFDMDKVVSNMVCSLCNGAGRIPMQTYKHGFYNCSCQAPPERFIEVSPSDFDFPMSATFRGSSFDYCEVKDPARNNIRETHTETIIIEQETDLKSIYTQLSEIKTKIQHNTHPKKDSI